MTDGGVDPISVAHLMGHRPTGVLRQCRQHVDVEHAFDAITRFELNGIGTKFEQMQFTRSIRRARHPLRISPDRGRSSSEMSILIKSFTDVARLQVAKFCSAKCLHLVKQCDVNQIFVISFQHKSGVKQEPDIRQDGHISAGLLDCFDSTVDADRHGQRHPCFGDFD